MAEIPKPPLTIPQGEVSTEVEQASKEEDQNFSGQKASEDSPKTEKVEGWPALIDKTIFGPGGVFRVPEMTLFGIVLTVGWIFIQDNEKGKITGITTMAFTASKAIVAGTIILVTLWSYRLLTARKGLNLDRQWAWFRCCARLYTWSFFVSLGLSVGYLFSAKVGFLGLESKEIQDLKRSDGMRAKSNAMMLYEADMDRIRKVYQSNLKRVEKLYGD